MCRVTQIGVCLHFLVETDRGFQTASQYMDVRLYRVTLLYVSSTVIEMKWYQIWMCAAQCAVLIFFVWMVFQVSVEKWQWEASSFLLWKMSTLVQCFNNFTRKLFSAECFMFYFDLTVCECCSLHQLNCSMSWSVSVLCFVQKKKSKSQSQS